MAQGHKEWLTLFALLLMAVIGVSVALLAWDLGVKFWKIFARYHTWDRMIEEASLRNNVDPLLVKAVIWRESRFRADASGLAGEVGLMQIRPEGAVADWARFNNIDGVPRGVLFTPELNIEIGSWYLGKAVRKWSNSKECFELALCEYNAGAKRSEAWNPVNPDESVKDKINISSTRAYVTSIMAKYNEYVKERDALANRKHEGDKRK